MGGVSGTGYFVLSLEYVVIIASSIIAAIGVTGELATFKQCRYFMFYPFIIMFYPFLNSF